MSAKRDLMKYDKKAREIAAKMTLDEKLSLMRGTLSFNDIKATAKGGYNATPWGPKDSKKYGIPGMKFCDGPRGIQCATSTCFPVTMARGATFDKELEERVGDVMGKEIRAAGGNYFGGVCINLPYNPGWGRSQECYGEDSKHMGAMAVQLVQGVQKHNVMACLKHYAFNSMENMRFKVSVEADKRTEREVYLRHFKECVDAGAASVMGAYNRYQGTYCCSNDYLINQVLRKEWGFQGFTISDFVWGVHEPGDIAAGLDIEMPIARSYKSSKVKKALKAGTIKPEQIDEAVVRIIRTTLAFTEAEDPQSYPAELGQCAEHTALAKEVAEKAITLLKNDGNLLPFSKESKSIIVVGKLAKDGNTGDHGSSWLRRANPDNLLDVLTKRFDEKVHYVDNSEVEANSALIAEADCVIAVLGLSHDDEGENLTEKTHIGGDRFQSLGIHPEDIQVIEKLGRLNKDKTAVVLIGGNMLLLDPWYDSVNSIVMAYYPGMRGGEAMANILFGDVNPGGKTPFVTPFTADDLPKIDWYAETQKYDYYHGYRKLDKEGKKPRVPYGFGLSYSSFELSAPVFAGSNGNEACFELTVTNTGSREGSEVPQLYVGFEGSIVDRPVKSLMDFERVYLSAGESKNITLHVKKSDLAFYDEENGRFVEEDIDYIAYIGNSSDNDTLTSIKFRF